MGSVLLNASLAFLMCVTLVFRMGDADSILSTTTGYPFIQVFYNATRSYAGTNVMVAIVIVLLTVCCISEVAAASRQIWSFARDRGLPGSSWLSKVALTNSDFELLLIHSGLSWLEYPTARRPSFPCHQLPTVMHQHRVFRCAERHHIFGGHIGTGVVLHHHQLRNSSAHSWPVTTSTSMDTGEVWADHQRCSVNVPHSVDIFPDLAPCDSSHRKHNELGKRHALRHIDHCDGFLHLQGKA